MPVARDGTPPGAPGVPDQPDLPDPSARPDPAAPAGGWPSVAVVMPVRNEARRLQESVGAVLAQDYPGELEVVVAFAPSDDGTRDVLNALATDPRVRVVGNPSGATAAGLNAAIRASTGDVVARVDGHAVLPPGYLRRAVGLLAETGADNVGGIMAAEGTTTFERAVAAAMSSRFGTGDARFHYGGPAGAVDTVYLGVFRRSALDRVGGFDETLVRTQDSELNLRIRQTGGTVWFSPELAVRYRPRSTLRGLARQYFEYGRWRRVVGRRHPGSLRWRQLVPPVTVLACLAGAALGATGRRWGLLAPAGYGAGVVAASAVAGRGAGVGTTARLPLVFVVMHVAWAIGFLTSPPSLGARPVEALGYADHDGQHSRHSQRR